MPKFLNKRKKSANFYEKVPRTAPRRPHAVRRTGPSPRRRIAREFRSPRAAPPATRSERRTERCGSVAL